ncbi:unnamed protein product [Euphydryas editha]|uniref:Uncharacterized protein n=1 Tax=Euphydryas editha TaxID=104508 RepID=A0AAU9TXQ4_EUPED|nr:unnamed protein product [Euphydryas editha]
MIFKCIFTLQIPKFPFIYYYSVKGCSVDALTEMAVKITNKREINHVDRLRQQYWESDRLQELNERELIISVGADSESDTDSIFSDSESEISDVESMDVSD